MDKQEVTSTEVYELMDENNRLLCGERQFRKDFKKAVDQADGLIYQKKHGNNYARKKEFTETAKQKDKPLIDAIFAVDDYLSSVYKSSLVGKLSVSSLVLLLGSSWWALLVLPTFVINPIPSAETFSERLVIIAAISLIVLVSTGPKSIKTKRNKT